MNHFNIPGQSRSGVRIATLVLVQTGTYQDQQLRPFEVRVTENVISQLQRATNDGRNLGVSAVQDVATDVIVPVSQVEGAVGIQNGWNMRRFRGLMKVYEEHPVFKGTVTQRIFFIYTDNSDASTNYLEPAMRIYFNSETVISESIRNTIAGPQRQALITGSNQIVTPVDMVGGQNGLYSKPTAHLIRPEDAFSIGQTMHTIQRLQQSGQYPGQIDRAIDHRTMVGEVGAYQYSHRRDTSPTRYLSDTLGAFHHAVQESQMENEPGMFGAANMEITLGEAQSHVANSDIHKNSFLALLKERCGYMERGFVTFGDLCREFPEAATKEVTTFSMDDGRGIRQVYHAGQSNHFRGADYTSIGASMLAQTIPSLMMDTFFRTVSFAVTNGMGPGQYLFEFHPETSRSIIDGVNMIQYVREFERRLYTDALNSISRNNEIPFRISMSSDLSGDSVIDISINNEEVVRFVAPTFSDSLFSPVITRNDALPGQISNSLMYLVQSVIPNNQQSTAVDFMQQGMGQPQQNHMVQGYVHPVAPAATMQSGVKQNAVDFGQL